MKQILVIIASFFFLISFGQSRELTIEIKDIESLNNAYSDSIEIELTNQGFMNMGEQLTIPTKINNDRHSLLHTVNVQSDSTTLKIYFNKYGFVEIDNLQYLDSDTLTIGKFILYPDCEQKGKWFRKTIYDNDADGVTDFLNYEEEVKSEFDFQEGECIVPDSLSLTINGVEYISEVDTKTLPGLITTGHGYKRNFWIGKKRYFHFKKVELNLIRIVKIKIN